MADFFSDIGNWLGNLFGQQNQNSLWNQNQVSQAVKTGSAMPTTSQYTQPIASSYPVASAAPMAPTTMPATYAQTQYPTLPTPYVQGYPQYPSVTPQTQQATPQAGTPSLIDQLIAAAGGGTAANQAMSEYERALIEQRQREAELEKWRYQQQFEQSARESTALESYRQQQLAAQQQQAAQEQARHQAQLEAEKQQRLATLAAQPKSWLEYASLSGQVPVIQPWMMPLMPQEYGIKSVGTQIPGYNAQTMTGMPNLLTPSTQLQARMGPTAQQQYYGYQQAQQGATPEETQFRLWQYAPTSGRNVGIRQVR